MLSKASTAISQALSSSPALSVGIGAAVALYGAWKLYQKLYAPTVVKSLRIFPVKSCRGFEVDEWEIGEFGFLYDRAWMIVREKDNKFITQREVPTMVLIKTIVDPKTGTLHLNFPGMGVKSVQYTRHIEVNDSNADKVKKVTIWSDTVTAFDCGNEVAQWLSTCLKQNVRLVQVIDQFIDARTDKTIEIKHHQRPPEEDVIRPFTEQGVTISYVSQFADAYPFLLTSDNSVRDFNKQVIADQSSNAISAWFNTLSIKPYEEEKYRQIEINGIPLFGVKRCTRCTMPSVDTAKGVKRSFITDSLNKHRFCKVADGTVFGMNLCHQAKNVGSKIRVGQEVKVKEVAFVK
ncbi:hypothetical protein C9374_001364 [Naegleria lovaniensis]|uniref:MOSC domain-containing protein n=1 Tax=Naegleria lovaniensis TaxID=51637 RepID=A0AA88GRX6_NAELO|nr:uncharacterized protein C9374_001364 [Naegleria lovaniensis]KAG2387770.1 hypothetical protein C9374_001364 [Naegleria lovaniensis]